MSLFTSLILLTLALIFGNSAAIGSRTPAERDFEVVERRTNETTKQVGYYLRTIRGNEVPNNSLNRLSMPSENQLDYPTPQSGCGPTAMLNILVWYEKYGLITPHDRDADLKRYKSRLFREIDRRLQRQSGTIRTEESGVNNLDAAMVMDAIIRERSSGTMRIHTDAIQAPLKLNDLLDSMQNYRSGYLVLAPKDANTGKLLRVHAASLIRADRAGYITLATWGQHYRGLLKTRPDGQWFIPQDPSHMELKIYALTRFIPFRPTVAADQ